MAAEMHQLIYGNIRWAVGYDDVTTDSSYSVFDNSSNHWVNTPDGYSRTDWIFKAEFEFDATRKSGLQGCCLG